MVDRKGLITNSRGDELPSHKKMFARKDGPNIKVTDPHPVSIPHVHGEARCTRVGLQRTCILFCCACGL